MLRPNPSNRHRALRLLVAAMAFLLGSAILVAFVVRGYLIPAYEAWSKADPQQRSLLSASSSLLLAVILVVLLLLLVTAFGVRRFFHLHQHNLGERVQTPVVDAWAESARRIKAPAAEDDGPPGEDRANS